jgi:hypothetical protein
VGDDDDKTAAPLHLKSYQIDGRLLRTGELLGVRPQDNDLVVIETDEAAAAFNRTFDARIGKGEPLLAGPNNTLGR